MTCERFQTVVSDLARSEIRSRRRAGAASAAEDLRCGDIPSGVALMEANDCESALKHIDECERCAQAWSDQRELSEGMRTLALQMKSWQAPVHLEEQLLVAFRDRNRVRSSRPQHWRYWATAAAAVLLIACGLMAWRFHVASLAESQIQANSKTGTTSPAASPKLDRSPVAVTGGDPTQHQRVPPAEVVAHRRRAKSQPARRDNGATLANRPTTHSATAVAADTEAREVVTDFVALGYGSAMDLQDGGQLVRVELPRSALARFGLPMNMDRSDERIKADVLVGADGLARAIRFVK